MDNKNNVLWTITPLKWEHNLSDISEEYFTSTEFGSFNYRRERDDIYDDNSWSNWRWSYCFDEYYDEDYGHFDTKEECKQYLEDLWTSRLERCLTHISELGEDIGDCYAEKEQMTRVEYAQMEEFAGCGGYMMDKDKQEK